MNQQILQTCRVGLWLYILQMMEFDIIHAPERPQNFDVPALINIISNYEKVGTELNNKTATAWEE